MKRALNIIAFPLTFVFWLAGLLLVGWRDRRCMWEFSQDTARPQAIPQYIIWTMHSWLPKGWLLYTGLAVTLLAYILALRYIYRNK